MTQLFTSTGWNNNRQLNTVMLYRTGQFKVSTVFNMALCLSRLLGNEGAEDGTQAWYSGVSELKRYRLSSGFMKQFVGQTTREKRSVQKRTSPPPYTETTKHSRDCCCLMER